MSDDYPAPYLIDKHEEEMIVDMDRIEGGVVVGQQFSLAAKILNGGIAGLAGVSTVFPIDLAKTRLQFQHHEPAGRGSERFYSGLLDCLAKTVRSDGVRGLYRGLGVNLLLVAPQRAVMLSSNDLFRHLLTLPGGRLPLDREVLAGAATGVVHCLVTTPLELLKVRQQNSDGWAFTEAKLRARNPMYTPHARHTGHSMPALTSRTLIRQIARKGGMLGLYKGNSATLLREVTFSLIYFPLVANINALGPRRSPNSSHAVYWWSFLAGCMAGAVSASAVTPADVVKTRLQLQSSLDTERRYAGVVDAFRQIMRAEGIAGLLAGALPRVLIFAPMFGMAQMFYFFGIGEHILGIPRE